MILLVKAGPVWLCTQLSDHGIETDLQLVRKRDPCGSQVTDVHDLGVAIGPFESEPPQKGKPGGHRVFSCQERKIASRELVHFPLGHPWKGEHVPIPSLLVRLHPPAGACAGRPSSKPSIAGRIRSNHSSLL